MKNNEKSYDTIGFFLFLLLPVIIIAHVIMYNN